MPACTWVSARRRTVAARNPRWGLLFRCRTSTPYDSPLARAASRAQWMILHHPHPMIGQGVFMHTGGVRHPARFQDTHVAKALPLDLLNREADPGIHQR